MKMLMLEYMVLGYYSCAQNCLLTYYADIEKSQNAIALGP